MNIPQRLKMQSAEQLAQRVMQLEDALVKCNSERQDLNAAFNSLSDAVYNRREVAAEREACAKRASKAIMSIKTGTDEARDWTLADLRGICANAAQDAIRERDKLSSSV